MPPRMPGSVGVAVGLRSHRRTPSLVSPGPTVRESAFIVADLGGCEQRLDLDC